MKPGPYYPALTGLRAVAAYAVFLFHFPPVAAGAAPTLFALFREGHIGVSLFFTLSGFLICRRYYGQLFTPAALRAYCLRRWARIYPVFFLVTTATFFVDKHYRAANAAEQYLANVTLLKGFSPRLAFTIVPPTWSLTVEECFYLLAPGLFWLGRRLSPAAWVGVALALLALGLACYGWPPAGPAFADSPAHFMLDATIFGRSAEFLVGAGFALLGRGRMLPRATWAGAGLLALGLGLLTLVQLHYGRTSIDTGPGLALNNLLLPLGTGLLLHGLTTEASGLQRLLASAPLQKLGRASYGFYLVHMGSLHDHLLARLPAGLPLAAQTGLTLLLTAAASVGLYYLVEQPLHRLVLRATGLAESRSALT
jgi:peptidoglycan/LPS O-acetylase OafA/YrhL